MRIFAAIFLLFCSSSLHSQTLNNHKVQLDDQSKILARISYHDFLQQRWNFIKHKVPNSPGPSPRSLYPQYYFYCAYILNNGELQPDNWMNDIGEKVPNWFESARLYYAYSGDTSVMEIVKKLADYSLEHGISAKTFAWPDFPYTTTNAGDTIFRGFTSAKRFALHEIQVDHAGEIGLTYYRLYQYTGENKYLDAAVKIANTLAAKVRTGTATHSPWPYRVIMSTGKATAEYGANWFGCYELLDLLQKEKIGNTLKYKAALAKVRDFILKYPVQTGYWTDGHTDTEVNSHTYKSNMSASNARLFMFDRPTFNPQWKKDIPRMIKWTEKYFIERGAPGEPGHQWGANIVGEQDSFLYKMDYQTARYAAECARWYAATGDEAYKEKAYRSLNWVTYCSNEEGLAFESPLSKNVNSWWSDCYGEGPRMFYHVFAAIPEWAPVGQDHILYSTGVLKDVSYTKGAVEYTGMDNIGKEYVKLKLKPVKVTLNGTEIKYETRKLDDGSYYLIINREKKGKILVSSSAKSEDLLNDPITIKINPSRKFQKFDGIGVNANTRSWNGNELKPAIDLLLDSMNANIWRVVVETVEKWEEENDNNDPFIFNWDYYNKLYETPKFQKAWETIRYLNERGVTGNLMINFMGPVPEWMGKKTVLPQYEDEYVEMISSFFWYAKNKKHLKIGLISPTNESDWRNEGPELDEFHYASVLRKLITRMDSLGMGDIKYVGPDPADMKKGIQRYIPEMMKDTVIMKKLAHIGLHSYAGYYANVDSAIKNSNYPNSTYWITEWNAWRDGLDDGKIGVYDYKFASQCVGYLLELLRNGASGFMEWEGYDSYYEHHYPSLFSYWGILGYDPRNKTYSPRKHFYAIQQVSKFVTPGSYRIETTGADSLNTVAFVDAAINKLVITGINNKNHPVSLDGSVGGMELKNIKMSFTDSINNLHGNPISIIKDSFQTSIPANSIFTITADLKKKKVQPTGWYSGDIHVHRNCGNDSVLSENKLPAMMEENDLDVISLLADMGNGEVKNAPADLKKINGKDAEQSAEGRIIHWDAEWHWDATYSNFSHQALGGHLVMLGLKNAAQIWEESPYKILEWAKKQDAVKGLCHFQYLNDSIQNELNCCIPIDYPVEAALGNIDFVAEDVYGNNSPNNGNYNSEAAMNAYYKLLNCGFKLGLAAGTDYPCNDNEPLGKLLTYVKVKDGLTYDKWVKGIKYGNTVVSRNGNNEFIDLKIDGTNEPGDEINLDKSKQVEVYVQWTSAFATHGTIELVCNGKVIASHTAYCTPDKPVVFKAKQTITKSSWIIARRMYKGEHQSHTAPVYIKVNNKPIRANADDALFFVKWIDNILKNIEPGGKWSQYFTKTQDPIKQHYLQAKNIYTKIAEESRAEENAPILILSEKGNYIEEILKAEGFNSFVSGSTYDLQNYDLVILPKSPVSAEQAEMLKKHVKAGGNLIAFNPDRNLAALFGLLPLNDSISNGYISILPQNNIGKGLITTALQIHGTAEKYKTSGAKVIASIENKFPAVSTNKYGKGNAIAFTYDLPMNILLTRQGNPRSAALEKDGIKGLRAMDLFTDGWVDTSKNIYNQADEQMRLLTHCIESVSSKPLPRFWYFPGTLKTLVTLTNDGEYSDEKDIDPQLADVEAKKASMSLYILTAGKISNTSTEAWQKRGHEMSGHPDNTQNAEHPTWENMNAAIEFKIKEIAEKYDIPSMRTVVNHWFVWNGTNQKGMPDFTAQAQIEKMHGIEMDINYAHYDNNSPQKNFLGSMGYTQGNYTGSGLPMKFGDLNGKTLSIYQHFNNVYDQQYMEHSDSTGFFNCFKGLMDRSINNEMYSYISVKSHNDEYFFSKQPLSKMLDYANSKNIPVWAPVKLLDFLKAKDQSSFTNINWSNNNLSFTIDSDIENNNMLTVMVPYTFKEKKAITLTSNSLKTSFTVHNIKGYDYVMFSIKPGSSYNINVQYQ